MHPLLSRSLFASLLLFLGASLATAREDEDPVYDGKKASEWVDTLINDSSARKRSLAVDALAKLWDSKGYAKAIPTIGRALRLDNSVAVRSQAANVLSALKESDFQKV
ncbi:MAG TPA: HEAT repeat domain-containing protein, partial [Gemmata sp.]|nr:HEAT repeat domain-containing protein [Gemmata sp.]